ncbi:MAG: hypothetical protein V7739_07360 [Motiliproteus sp.]
MNPDNQILLISILLAVLISALGINYFFHSRQQAEINRRLLSKQIKIQIELILDVLTVLKQTTCSPHLVSALTDHSIELIGRLKRLNPASDITDQLQGNFAVATTPALVIHSERGIQQAQRSIQDGSKLLRSLKQQGRLTPLQFSEFSQELSWIHCLIEADAHVEHGKKLLENNKNNVAIAHFKQAKTAVTKLGGTHSGKVQKTEEINKLISDAKPAETKDPAPAQGSADKSGAESK